MIRHPRRLISCDPVSRTQTSMTPLNFCTPKPCQLQATRRPQFRTTNICRTAPSMSSTTGRSSLYGGVAALAAVLTNRLVFTPIDSLALTQSRSDILGVIAGATLVLYGVGKAEIADAKKAVELTGVDVYQGFSATDSISMEVDWIAKSLCYAVSNVKSVAVLVNGVGKYFYGRFREETVQTSIVDGGIVAGALSNQKRVYIGDMKVVPVKEIEFSFLPDNCQSVIIQPINTQVVLILGADKARPFTGDDFGWLQAITDRLEALLTEESS